MLGNRVEQLGLSIMKHQQSRLIPCAYIHALDPSHGMDWRDIMSWNPIDGMIPRKILLDKGILQPGPLGTDNDGALRWYHNPQVPGLRWHQDPSESIEGRNERRIFWNPCIEGSIHDHLAWKHGITHWFVRDLYISIQMCLLWMDVDILRESNLGVGGFEIFPFLYILKMEGICPWYLLWYFPMVSTHDIFLHFSRENNK